MSPDTSSTLPALLSVLLWLASTAIGALVAFFAFQRAIERKFGEMDVKTTKVEGELARINDHLEGIDAWIKTLRERSHEVIKSFQELFVKVDRIEQRGHQFRNTDRDV